MTDAEFGDTVSGGQWRRAFAMLRSIAVAFAMMGALIASAAAQEPSRSECLAMANAPPRAAPVSLRRLAAKTEEVTITYAGHSTYYIDTPGGVRIATDFSGAYRTGRLPDVVTMNRAHSTHYTLFPDSHIPHVFHGGGDDGQPAKIAQRVGDVCIRNVTTDIRRDIVMVPIDGSYPMSLDGISEITQRLRSSVVLPMHRFMTPLDDFMRRIGQQFAIDVRAERSLTISRGALPGTPTVIILDGV